MNGQYYFSLWNNVDWTQAFQISDYDADTNTRAPHDLTGAELKMTLVPQESGALSKTLSSTTGEITISSGGFGDFVISVPAATMWTLSAGMYTGDMLVFQNGTTKQVFTCEVEILSGETAPTP